MEQERFRDYLPFLLISALALGGLTACGNETNVVPDPTESPIPDPDPTATSTPVPTATATPLPVSEPTSTPGTELNSDERCSISFNNVGLDADYTEWTGATTLNGEFADTQMRIGLENHAGWELSFAEDNFEDVVTQVINSCGMDIDAREDSRYPLIMNFIDYNEYGGKAIWPELTTDEEGNPTLEHDRLAVSLPYVYIDILPSILQMRHYDYEEGSYTDAVHDWLINQGFSENDLLQGDLDDLFDMVISKIALEETIELPLLNQQIPLLEDTYNTDITDVQSLATTIGQHEDTAYPETGFTLPAEQPDELNYWIDNYCDHLSLPITSAYVEAMTEGVSLPFLIHDFDKDTMLAVLRNSQSYTPEQINTIEAWLNAEQAIQETRVDYFD
ncbi:hypothetical protein GF362_04220 [Candidatus Dojkabacteria bacterium]|nr:hypothetical protein [Candidatus Dojkabacteria bacterium]